MKKNIISIKNLSVSYGEHVILDKINFDIDSGEIVAIIGPNGSGKSTLVKVILGLVAYEGDIKIWNQKPQKNLKKIGYVPQRFTFDKNFPLTVKEFLNLSLHHKDPSLLKKSLEEVEMTKHKNKLIGKLSGGQLQRILIAKAILNQPKLIFFDEPTAGIDLEGEKDFYEIIRHQNEVHNVTIIIISHEVSMVYKQATQVICLNRSLFCMGQPKEAITKDVLQQLYGEEVALKEHKH